MKEAEPEVVAVAELPQTGSPGGKDSQRGAGKPIRSLKVGEWFLVAFSFLLVILTFPVSLWLCLKVVNEFEQAIILRLGHMRKGGPLGPGEYHTFQSGKITEYFSLACLTGARRWIAARVYFVLPCTDQMIRVDMRTKAYYLPLQEIISKDPLVLDVDGVMYYRVQNPTMAVTSITSAEEATKLLAQTTLRNVLGTMYLSHLICNREKIAQSIQSAVDDTASSWGVKVELIEIKNVRTRVKVVPPSEQGSSSPLSKPSTPRIMKEASVVIGHNPVSFQIRCLTSEAPSAGPQSPSLAFSYS